MDALAASQIASELGDCLWYIARIADEIEWTMEDVIELNIEKLTDRQERDALGGSGDTR